MAKRTVSLIVALVLIATLMLGAVSFDAFDDIGHVDEYTIPEATVAPTIDGVMSTNEWYGAYHYYIGQSDDKSYDYIQWNPGVTHEDACTGWDVYMMWMAGDDELVYYYDEFDVGGLYIAVVCDDGTDAAPYRVSGDANCPTDMIQVAVDAFCTGARGDMSLFDFTPYSAQDSTHINYFGEATTTYVRYGGSLSGFDPRDYYFVLCESTYTPNTVEGGVVTERGGYVMECFIPWMTICKENASGEAVIPERVEGTELGLGLVFQDWHGASDYYECIDFGDGDSLTECVDWPLTYNIVTLGAKVEAPKYAQGDVNMSGETPDIADALLLFKHVAGLETITDETALALAELDGVEGVGIGDALYLFKLVAGLIPQ